MELSEKNLFNIASFLLIFLGVAWLFTGTIGLGFWLIVFGVMALPQVRVLIKKEIDKRKDIEEPLSNKDKSNEIPKTESQKTEPTHGPVKCPKCGSTEIFISKRGFDASDACCGAFLCGPLGLLFGAQGSNKIQRTCLKCNKTW